MYKEVSFVEPKLGIWGWGRAQLNSNAGVGVESAH